MQIHHIRDITSSVRNRGYFLYTWCLILFLAMMAESMCLRDRDKKVTYKPSKIPLTPAERAKMYREKLKNDTTYKEKERVRKQISRLQWSEEKKEQNREQCRVRQQKFRDRRKEQGINKQAPVAKTKVLTRTERERRRAYWREKKKESREKQTAQKKRRCKEKDRDYQQNRRNIDVQTSKSTISRAPRVIPKDPAKFVSVLESLVRKATPRKQTLLRQKHLLHTPKSQKKLKFLEASSSVIKEVLTENPSFKKKTVRRLSFLKKYRLSSQLSTFLGVRESSISKQSNSDNLGDTRKKRKDATSEAEKEKIEQFFTQSDVSTNLPTAKRLKKDQTERRILDRPIEDTYQNFKSIHPESSVSLATFNRNRPKNVETTKKRQWLGCLCEVCTNVELKLRALSLIADKCGSKVKVRDKYQAVAITMCDKVDARYHNLQCIQRKCADCGCDGIVRYFQPLAVEIEDASITYSKWQRVKKIYKGREVTQVMPVSHRNSVTHVVVELSNELEKLAGHLFVASWQQHQFSLILKKVKMSWVLLNIDFAENYSCISQTEVQSAHWGHNQVTIHPTCAYYQCQEDNCENTVTEHIIFVSDDKTHDAAAVMKFIELTNTHLQQKRGLSIHRQIQMSDGCAAQYKSKVPFTDVSYSLTDFGFPTERHFYGSRHGKGPSDGAGAVVKSTVRRAVMGGNIIVNNATDLYNFAKQKLSKEDENHKTHFRRTIILENDINHERPERENCKTMKGTRQVQCVRTVKEMVVETRNLSCFCDTCLETTHEGNCANESYVQGWIPHQLDGQSGRGRPSTRGAGRGGPRTRGGVVRGGPRTRGGVVRGGPRTRGGVVRGRPRTRGGVVRGGPRTRGGVVRGGPRTRGAGIDELGLRNTRTRRGQVMARGAVEIDQDRQIRGRQSTGLRARGRRGGQVNKRGGKRNQPLSTSSSEDEDSLGCTTEEDSSDEESSLGNTTGAVEEFGLQNTGNAKADEAFDFQNTEADLYSSDEDFGNLSGLSTILLSLGEEEKVFGSSPEDMATFPGPGPLFPAMLCHLAEEGGANLIKESGPKSVDAPCPKSVDVPGPKSVDAHCPKSVDVPGPKSVDAPCPKSVDVPGPKSVDAPCPKSVDVPGPKSVDEYGSMSVDALGPKSVDESGHESVDAPGPMSVDVPGPKSVDVPGHKSVDESGHKSVDVPGHKSVDVPGHKSVDESGPKSVDDPSPKSVDEPSPMSVDVPGHKSVDESGPKSVDDRSPKSVDESSPMSVDAPGPKSVDESGHKSVDVCGHWLVDESGSKSVYDPGHKSVDVPGPMSVDVPDPKSVNDPGPKSVDEPGHKSVDEPGHKSRVESGPMSVDDPGPMSVYAPGPKSIDEPGPKSVDESGPKSVDVPGPKSVDESGPMSVDAPGTKSVDAPGHMSVDAPGPKSVDVPGPKSVDESCQKSVDESGTESVYVPGPKSVDESGPMSVDEPGHNSVDEPGPMSIDAPGPKSVDVPSPKSVDESGPKSVDEPGTKSVDVPSPKSVEEPGPMSEDAPGPMSVDAPGPMSVDAPGPMSVESGPKSVEESVFRERYLIGDHVLVKFGTKLLPAVVVATPADMEAMPAVGLWVQYFKKVRADLWSLEEKPFFLDLQNVSRCLEPPSLTAAGTRFYYKLKL